MNLGQRTNSDVMHSMLVNHFKKQRDLSYFDWVRVHHYTDTPIGVQIEYEIQWEDEEDGIEFGRELLKLI